MVSYQRGDERHENPSKLWISRYRFWLSNGFDQDDSRIFSDMGINITSKDSKKIAKDRLRGVKSIQEVNSVTYDDAVEVAKNPFMPIAKKRGVFRAGIAKRITGPIVSQALSERRFSKFQDSGFTNSESRILANSKFKLTSKEVKRFSKKRYIKAKDYSDKIIAELLDDDEDIVRNAKFERDISRISKSFASRDELPSIESIKSQITSGVYNLRDANSRRRVREMEKDGWHRREIRYANKKKYPYLLEDIIDEGSRKLYWRIQKSIEWRRTFIRIDMNEQRASGRAPSFRLAVAEANLELRRRVKARYPELSGEQLDDMLLEGSP